MTTIINGSTSQTDSSAKLTSFVFNGTTVRGAIVNGIAEIIAKDICEGLALDYREALRRVPEWVKGGGLEAPTLGGVQTLATLKEAGVYWLTMRSDRPEAEAFQKWLCEEVLPALRKTGSYTTPGAAAADAGYVVTGRGAERIERLRALLQIERGLHLYESRRDAVLRGESLATPAVHVEGAVTVQPFLVAELPHLPMPRIRTLVQLVVGRLQRSGRPLGRIMENSHWQRTARPEDMRSVIPPADLAGAKGGA